VDHLSAIAANANNPRKPLAGLSSLTELSLQCSDIMTNSSLFVEDYLPLLTIDSLRTLYSVRLRLSGDQVWPNCPCISRFSKNLLTVILENSILGRDKDWKDGLLALLSRMPEVTCFKLSLEARRRSVYFWIPAQLIVDEIATHLPSLEYLAFGVCRIYFYANVVARPGMARGAPLKGLSISPTITCMKKFKHLLAVELDIRLFVWGRFLDGLPPLVDVLPMSITSLLLFLPNPDHQWPFEPTVKEVMRCLGRNFSAE
jgi:hypothetical protein